MVTLTHGLSNESFDLFIRNLGVIPSQYFGTISTSVEGSFNNNSYRPFILEFEDNIIELFKCNPCFYIPGYSEDILDKYGLFNPRFLWEWEIFFKENISEYYAHTIYAVYDKHDAQYNGMINDLIDKYENEIGTASIVKYEYHDEKDNYWGNAEAWRTYKDMEYVLKSNGVTFEKLFTVQNKPILENCIGFMDEINEITAELTGTEDTYNKIINDFKSKYGIHGNQWR